ncbi:MAG: gas vesicle protein, partial [Actinomycetota bacterium]|nr:gas vesicle protein [Actinomycetota bacterium]
LERQVTLLDLVDRILEKGAVVRGQVVLTVADVDLVKLDLSLLLASVEALEVRS